MSPGTVVATSHCLFRLALSACSSSLSKVDVEGVEADVSLCVFGLVQVLLSIVRRHATEGSALKSVMSALLPTIFFAYATGFDSSSWTTMYWIPVRNMLPPSWTMSFIALSTS